jgi:hypothetical protein
MLLQSNKFNKYFLIYISSIFLFAVFYLFEKHDVGNDSTISEWMINYQGGFTRRGIVGEICFQIANYLDLSLRYTIFIFQTFLYLVYSILIYLYIKNLPKNILTIIAIFSPIFLLYPIAEIEVLARKEIFLFIGIIIFFNLSDLKYNSNTQLIYVFFIFPILCLIWEPFIFFYLFVLYPMLVRHQDNTLTKLSLKIIVTFSSSVFVILFILTNLLSVSDHLIMKEALMINFGETCYMSCELLGTKSSIQAQLNSVSELITFKIFIRYLIIILIGFSPLIILYFNTSLKKKILFFKTKNLLPVLIFLNIPVIFLFTSATDWGRWVNISYTFSILLYLYLLKNNLVIINKKILFFDNFYSKKKKLFIIFFIIFAFCWNQKTSMKADIATNSLYKIFYNSSKRIFDFKSIRLFQDSPIIRFHKKYIE